MGYGLQLLVEDARLQLAGQIVGCPYFLVYNLKTYIFGTVSNFIASKKYKKRTGFFLYE